MTRKLRPALNIVSDIGSLGFDLQHHTDEHIAAAVALLGKWRADELLCRV